MDGFSYRPLEADVPHRFSIRGPVTLRLVRYCEFPLWADGSLLSHEYDELPPELPLTRATYDGLVAWNEEAETLVATESAVAAHRQRGHELFGRLTVELAHYEVVHDEDYDYGW